MAKVRYVGHKPLKRDTVTDSLAIWPGHGSIAEVPDDVAVRLFQFPDVWEPEDRTPIERPRSPAIQAHDATDEWDEDVEVAPVDPATDEEVRPNDEFGFEQPAQSASAVTPEEIVQILPDLDRETEFTEHGRPIVGKVRERFPGREVTISVVKAAWESFRGE